MARVRRIVEEITDWRNKPRNPDMDKRVVEAIGRRRRQMLIHCCIYYRYDENVVDDHTWNRWAQQLAKLQKKYGWRIGFYDRVFRDWDGSSGFHLPADSDVMRVARRILEEHRQREFLLS